MFSRLLIVIIFGLLLILVIPSSFGQTPKPMTNADVVAMVKAGLSEAAIIASVRNSPHDFETGVSALITLKQTGVSNAIIEAMIAPPQSGLKANIRVNALPSSYGYYVFDGGKFSELELVEVITKFGLTLGDRGFAVDGLLGQQTMKVSGLAPTIFAYQQSAAIDTLHLSTLTFVDNMKAYQFNIANTAPQFFRNAYGKNPNDTVSINLWRPTRDVQIRIEPVDGKAGAYKLVPTVPLVVGRYALYFSGALHASDLVFGASAGRRATAFEFEVVEQSPFKVTPPPPNSANVSGSSTVVATEADCDSAKQCLDLANRAVVSKRFRQGFFYAEKGIQLDATNLGCWGILAYAAAGLGEFARMENAWDESISRGFLSVVVCTKGATGCKSASLRIRTTSATIGLWEGPERVFETPLSLVSALSIQGREFGYSYSALRVKAASQEFILVPGVTGDMKCHGNVEGAISGFFCPESGLVQQEKKVEYLTRKIEALKRQ